jgi:hypothetical protein
MREVHLLEDGDAIALPAPMLAVAHSPTPSIVRIAAWPNGDGKKRWLRVIHGAGEHERAR